MNFSQKYLNEANQIIGRLDEKKIEKMVDLINEIKSNEGRIFF